MIIPLLGHSQLGHAAYAEAYDLHQQAQLDWQRYAFKKAAAAIRQRASDRERWLRPLNDYALRPYLDYLQLEYSDTPLSAEAINNYSAQYPNAPYTPWLQATRLKQLSMEADPSEFIEQYQPGSAAARYDCLYFRAQLQQGNTTVAWEGAKRLWLTGRSQDAACDPLFAAWTEIQPLTDDLIWTRFNLALEQKQTRLARYLSRQLSPPQETLAKHWLSLLQSPELLTQTQLSKFSNQQQSIVATSVIKQWIQQDPIQAQERWTELSQQIEFNSDQIAAVHYDLAFTLGIRRLDGASHWLDLAVQDPRNLDLIPLGIRHGIYLEDWTRVRNWLALLPNTEMQQAEWRYWRARSAQLASPAAKRAVTRNTTAAANWADIGKLRQLLTNPAQLSELLPASVRRAKFGALNANQALADLAAQRGYYGFLASTQLNRPVTLNNAPSTPLPLPKDPAIDVHLERMREFHAVGLPHLARTEWQALLRASDEDTRSQLAYYAYHRGWFNESIRAAYRSDAHDDIALRFPQAFQPIVKREAAQNDLHSDWVFAIIRQESAFLPSARSPAGALGMMQLMPATARQIASHLGTATSSRASLLKPEQNIEFGTRYLRQLMSEFDGNQILATAAYNAGPQRAREWQPEHWPVSAEIWIESIPFHETRDYVKNVLTYQTVYGASYTTKASPAPAPLFGAKTDGQKLPLGIIPARRGPLLAPPLMSAILD